MTFKNTVAVAGALALVAAASVAPARANTYDARSHFAFSSPVAIPGTTLPAGEYVFRLADPDSGRSIVQVLDLQGNVYGMFFTQRSERGVPADTAEVRLGEAPEGQPRSIRDWWQPGETSGRSFMYRPGEASWERESVGAPVAD